MSRYRKKVDVNDKNKRSFHLWSKKNTVLTKSRCLCDQIPESYRKQELSGFYQIRLSFIT